MSAPDMAGAPAPDDELTALLTASIERILADRCTPATLRACEGEGAEGADAGALWAALEAAGLVSALAADGGDGALGWPEVRPMIEACGRFGLPVPLAETLAAQALARLAGASLPEGATTVALARADGASVTAESVAHPRLATRALVSLPDPEGGAHALWLFDLARARAEPSAAIAEQRARLTWARAEGRELGRLPAGVSALAAGAAVRSAQIAGGCARVVEMTCGYANDRVQFGRPISKFQAIQQQLALAGEWAAMAAMASQLALAGPGVSLDPVRVACAKQVASDAAQVCAQVAHAVHGAIGVTAEYDLQLYTRRLWSWAADFGSSLHWAREVGAGLLAHAPRFSWDAVIGASSA